MNPTPAPAPTPPAAPSTVGRRALQLGLVALVSGPASVGVGFALIGTMVGLVAAGALGLVGVLSGLGAIVLGCVALTRTDRGVPLSHGLGGLVLGLLGAVGAGWGGAIGLLFGAGGGAHGRPLRRGGRAITAAASADDAWSTGNAPAVDGLARALRDRLAAAWTRDALAEHASVATFAQLALQLMAVGAPAHLVDAALGAAREEVGHARLCFALASAYAGHPVGAGALPEAALLESGDPATRLALEALLDGCVEEAAAARVAAACARSAHDPAVRAVLTQIAAEEAGHAALSWSLVAWSRARDPEGVGAAVLRALDAMPRGGAGAGTVSGDAWDRPTPGSFEAARDAARDELRARLTPTLALAA